MPNRVITSARFNKIASGAPTMTKARVLKPLAQRRQGSVRRRQSRDRESVSCLRMDFQSASLRF